MKKQTIINKINKEVKKLTKEKAAMAPTGRARQKHSFFIICLQRIREDIKKLE